MITFSSKKVGNKFVTRKLRPFARKRRVYFLEQSFDEIVLLSIWDIGILD